MQPQATIGSRSKISRQPPRQETTMRQWTRWFKLSTLVVALAMVTACGAAAPSAQQSPTAVAATAGAPVPELVITAKEYSFAGPENIPGG
jgi:hypothetical protein